MLCCESLIIILIEIKNIFISYMLLLYNYFPLASFSSMTKAPGNPVGSGVFT